MSSYTKRAFILLALTGLLLTTCQSVTPTPRLTSETTAAPTVAPFWWNDAVFYEVFVRSFYDSDGDGAGDLNGLIERLDYLNDGDPATTDDLGVTGLWLMPIAQSPSYHGYDVTDYFTVDDEYGANEEYRWLMEEAHERSMRVVVDLVCPFSTTARRSAILAGSRTRTSARRCSGPMETTPGSPRRR